MHVGYAGLANSYTVAHYILQSKLNVNYSRVASMPRFLNLNLTKVGRNKTNIGYSIRLDV